MVERFIDAVRRNDAGALGLNGDVVFKSPLNRCPGVAAFFLKGWEDGSGFQHSG